MDITEVVIDEEFRDLLPPLAQDQILELEQLIDKHGWTEPLIVWEGHGFLIDGHHRYAIWDRDYRGTKLNPPEVIEMFFEDRGEVMEWMVAHQRSRRNWTKEERDEIIRKLYKEEVRPKPGAPKKNQNASKTAEKTISSFEPIVSEPPKTARKKVAETVRVSEATVQRVVSNEKPDKKTEAPSIVLDAINRPIPEPLTEHHAAAAAIQSAGSKLDQVKKLVRELAEKPGGEFLQVQQIEIALKDCKRLITHERYWSECPRCKGKLGKKCGQCDGNGFLPFSRKGKLSTADKVYLGVDE